MRAISTAATRFAIVKPRNAHSKWPFTTSGVAATGPTTRVRLLAADCSDTGARHVGVGTALAASAKLAGPANAKHVPSPAQREHGDGRHPLQHVSSASTADSAATIA
jgi:hypothetical protein